MDMSLVWMKSQGGHNEDRFLLLQERHHEVHLGIVEMQTLEEFGKGSGVC